MVVLASDPVPHRRLLPAVLLVFVALALAGCGFISTTAPPATPFDFPGIAGELAQRGLVLDEIASGDAGCDDPQLAPTAIRFTARGLDQTDATPLYLYIFRNRDAFTRLRTAVDACAATYVTDPAAFGSIEASPFVLAGPGPWAPEFAATLREVITESAGTGG
jgi:hypothetical protein